MDNINFNNLYISVYSFKDFNNYNTIDFDKVFFDFDNQELVEYNSKKIKRCQKDTIILHEDLMKDNIKHIINFSGRGFHVFVFLNKNYMLKNPHKDVLYNIHNYYEDKLNLDLDEKIKGDIRRVCRILNTINFKSTKKYGKYIFCVNINEELLYSDYNDIIEYATKPHKKIYVYGDKLLNPKKFDKKRDYNTFDFKINLKPVNISNYSKMLKEIYNNAPPCIRFLIDSKKYNIDLDNKKRYLLMLYLKESVYNGKLLRLDDVKNLMHEILSDKKWHHFSIEEGFRPLYSIFSKNYFFPNCNVVKYEYKICPYDCGRKNPRYEV